MTHCRLMALLAGGWLACAVGVAAERGGTQRDRLVKRLVQDGGVQRGVCAVLGARDVELAPAIARASELFVAVREPDASAAQSARKAADAGGLYGSRVIVESGPLDRLPYATGLLDAVICTSLSDADLRGVSLSEVLRVLRPGGKAILGRAALAGDSRKLTEARLRDWIRRASVAHASIGPDGFGLWAKLVKPLPEGTDEWTHWQHGPDNNPMSNDTVIRAPYMTQYLALPYYSTMPSISVISGGRMFRAAGHMAIHVREEPYVNTLYATNAHNGTLLWTRPLPEGLLVHRSMFVATPETLYLMGDNRCLLLDPATGAQRGEIVLPPDSGGGGHWKWMALEDGVLYVLLGGEDYKAEVIKRARPTGAWGWDELSRGYYEDRYPWGYGDLLVAVNARSKDVLWTRREDKPIDSRALCMKNGRLFLHSEGAYVACLDSRNGQRLWRNEDPKLLSAIAQPNDKGLGFKTTPYALCTDDAVYFAGRGRLNVVAVSAQDGRILWSVPGGYNATNLLFCEGYLYAHIPSCTMIDPLTGRLIKDLGIAKRSCARLTGCPEAIFHRGSIQNGEGTTRYDLASGKATVIFAFRPPCNDGILPAEGLLHVTQWDCDCNLQLMGDIALSPAGDFEYGREARESERLQVAARDPSDVALFWASARDWDTYRMNDERSSCTPVEVPKSASKLWEYQPETAFSPSAPTAAGGFVFLGGSDCKARAIDAATGKLRWRFDAAGPVRLPPTIWKGRAYVGSNDGYVYALEGATGRLLWRFRAAPAERNIMVFGSMWSTWPVNGGIVVRDGVAYAAAGIINYDGTHVYALDAITGSTKWQNNTSGHLNREMQCGASVQGDMAVFNNKLWLAAGNVVSPANYDLSDGTCGNPPPDVGWPAGPRGSEVFIFLSKYMLVGGRRLFAQDDDPIVNWSGFQVPPLKGGKPKQLPGRVPPAFGNGVVALSGRGPLVCVSADRMDEWLQQPDPQAKLEGRWTADSVQSSVAIVVAGNAVVAAGESPGSPGRANRWTVQAFDIQTGRQMWAEALPSAPLPGGLCVDRDGRTIVVLESGSVIGIGASRGEG